ncbi:MAG: thrombospondin type 3 repeat-containing protein [Chthoniobacterales bacterium]|nr:thrombospondin type 3 repeat-containing protein [Chthoniobacterales bacterium]
MEWVKKHYDGIILLIFALVAIGVSGYGLIQVFTFADLFVDRNSPKPRDNNIRQAELASLERAAENLDKKPKWNTYEGSLFVSRIYILKDNQLIDPMEGDTPLHPPVPNDWILKYNLDYSRSDVLEIDPDNDGFTVLEEYRAGTNPNDVNSVPPRWTKLRMKEYTVIPFLLKFSGTMDEGNTFSINYIDEKTKQPDPKRPTQMVSKGEQIEISGQKYTVVEYNPKKEVDPNSGLERDVSELVVQNKLTGDKIILVNGKITDSPTVYVSLVNLIDGQEVKNLKIGQEFSLTADPETKYRLESATENQAILINKKTGERLEIPRE